MAQTGRLLPLLLDNTLACSTPPLIVISDSLLQPGLLLLRQIIAESLTRSVDLAGQSVLWWADHLHTGKNMSS